MAKKKDRGSSEGVFLQNSIKTLVANIRFASVDKPVKTIVVTSSVPNEGKTTISAKLAEALAGGGKNVLLVECDLRRRSLSGQLDIHPAAGMYAVLSGEATLDDAVAKTKTANLYFLDSEPHIPNPVDILASRRFQQLAADLERIFDYVVYDTPPLSTFVDAAVVGALADATLLVVRRNFTKRADVAAAYDQLRKAGANVIGTVLNFCESGRSEYYYSYYNKEGKRLRERDSNEPVTMEDMPVPRAAPAHRPAPSVKLPQTQDVVPTRTPGATDVPPGRPAPAASSAASPNDTMQFLAGRGFTVPGAGAGGVGAAPGAQAAGTRYVPGNYDLDE